MKHYSALLMATVLATGVLAGCSSDKNSAKDPGSNETTAESTTVVEETAAAETFDPNFEFDGRHIVINGQMISFIETKLGDLPEEFYGCFVEDYSEVQLYSGHQGEVGNGGAVTFCPNLKPGDEFGEENLEISVYPYNAVMNDEFANVMDCVFSRIWVYEADTYIRSGALEGDEFNIDVQFGSGLTFDSTYDDFVAVLGEPLKDEIHKQTANVYHTYRWGSVTEDGYCYNISFTEDGSQMIGFDIRTSFKLDKEG